MKSKFMKRMVKLPVVILLVLIVSMMAPPITLGQASRSKLFGSYDAAKNEGVCSLYTSTPLSQSEPYIKAFMDRFPGVKVKMLRTSSSAIDARIGAEASAKRMGADVVMTSSFAGVTDWMNKGWLMKHCSPEYESYKSFKLPKGWLGDCFYFPQRQSYWFPVVNTDIVSPEDIARMDDYASIVDVSSQKGFKVGFGDAEKAGGQYNFYWIYRSVFGPDMFVKLGKMNSEYHIGNATLGQKVASGEIPVILHLADMTVSDLLKKGAPVKVLMPKSGLASQPIMVEAMKDAPHPNAARLWVDWTMSKEGQEAMVRIIKAASVREDTELPELIAKGGKFRRLSYEVDWTKNPPLKKEWVEDWVKWMTRK